MKKLILSTAIISLLLGTAIAKEKDTTADKQQHRMQRMEQKTNHMFDEVDANKDGAISKAEFDDAHNKKFILMDADKDGSLSRKELLAAKKHKMEQKRKMKHKKTS